MRQLRLLLTPERVAVFLDLNAAAAPMPECVTTDYTLPPLMLSYSAPTILGTPAPGERRPPLPYGHVFEPRFCDAATGKAGVALSIPLQFPLRLAPTHFHVEGPSAPTRPYEVDDVTRATKSRHEQQAC